MAGGMSMPATKGGRKSLDAAINLVPFIDLLSCCISFLLITAVWVQLASVPVAHGGQGGPGGDPPDVSLTLQVTSDGFLLKKSTGEELPAEAEAGRTDYAALAALMQQIKTEFPRKEDITVQAEDRVAYERLIRTLDILRGARFPAIHVSDR
jgi:biopolymer transport protein TolR